MSPALAGGFFTTVPPGKALAAQMVKNLPAMQETWVLSLAQEDPLEEEMGIHSTILAWEIPWTEEPDGLQYRITNSWTRNEWLSMHTCIVTQN